MTLKGKLLFIVILLVVIFSGFYIAQNFGKIKTGSLKTPISQQTQNVTPTAAPTQVPLDVQSAQATLLQTDTDLQGAINQVDNDLAVVGQINASLDNSTGL